MFKQFIYIVLCETVKEVGGAFKKWFDVNIKLKEAGKRLGIETTYKHLFQAANNVHWLIQGGDERVVEIWRQYKFVFSRW